MTTKLMTMIAALAVGTSLFADPCKCGKPECTCGDDCKCTAETCKCGCAVDEDALAEEEEDSIVSAEFSVKFDSRYLTYGVVDGKDPIMTLGGNLTFFDWVYVGVESIFDLNDANGKRGEYARRGGRYTTLDAIVGLAHEFDLGETLGTLSADFNYIYEYLPRYHDDAGDKCMDDTQYLNLELALNDLWLEPALWIERDLMLDNGTYVNFSLGHTFNMLGDEDDTLTLRPSIAQGWGDKHRVRGYELASSQAGLMDTTMKLELAWKVCECVSLGAYVAYSDYWFDHDLRDGARRYNRGQSYHNSYNFYGGVGLAVSF